MWSKIEQNSLTRAFSKAVAKCYLSPTLGQRSFSHCVPNQHVFPNSLVTYSAYLLWALLSFQNDLGAREDMCNSRRQSMTSLPLWHLYGPSWVKRQMYGWAGDSHGNIYRISVSCSVMNPEIRSALVGVSFLNPNLLYSMWIWRDQKERTWWLRKALTAELLHFGWHMPTHWPLDCTQIPLWKISSSFADHKDISVLSTFYEQDMKFRSWDT